MARQLHIEKRIGRGDDGELIWEDDFAIPEVGEYQEWEKLFGGSESFDDQLKSSYSIKTRASNDPRRKQTQVEKLDKMAIAEGFESWEDLKTQSKKYAEMKKAGLIPEVEEVV